jgi:group II intron reverse transcriptase/maturase
MSAIRVAAALPPHVLAAQLDVRAAWDRVRQNRGMAGADGTSIAAFSRSAPASLAAIERELAASTCRPWPLRLVHAKKPTGAGRILLVPSVRDRIGQTAVAMWLNGRIDAHLDPASFAYRPARGVRDALRALAAHRDAGYRHVLDADVRGCFDAVQHHVLLGTLARWLGGDSPLLTWIAAWVATPVWDGEALRSRKHGLPQGSPISPLLANIVLHPLDRHIRASGAALVRYADDFVVLARNPMDLADASRLVADALSDLGFTLNPEKTRRTTFDEGFRFLGADVRGGRIWLPIDSRPAGRRGVVEAVPPMPLALRRAWRAGHLQIAGPFVSDAHATARDAAPTPGAARIAAVLNQIRGEA